MKTTVRFLRHGGICRPMYFCCKSLDRSTAFRPGSAQTIKGASRARLRFTGTPILNPFRDRPQ
jgi:hypothetical protein